MDVDKIIRKNRVPRIDGINRRKSLFHCEDFYLSGGSMLDVEAGVSKRDWYVSLYNEEVNQRNEDVNQGKFGAIHKKWRRRKRKRQRKR